MAKINPEDIEDIMNEPEERDITEDIEEVGKNHTPLPESPASLNIKFWADGYGVMLTIRDNEVSSLMTKFRYMLDAIKKAGYKNKWDEIPVRVLPKSEPEEVKICSIHGTPMTWKSGISKKTGKPYGFFGCDKKLADGSWCPGKPMEEDGQN